MPYLCPDSAEFLLIFQCEHDAVEVRSECIIRTAQRHCTCRSTAPYDFLILRLCPVTVCSKGDIRIIDYLNLGELLARRRREGKCSALTSKTQEKLYYPLPRVVSPKIARSITSVKRNRNAFISEGSRERINKLVIPVRVIEHIRAVPRHFGQLHVPGDVIAVVGSIGLAGQCLDVFIGAVGGGVVIKTVSVPMTT